MKLLFVRLWLIALALTVSVFSWAGIAAGQDGESTVPPPDWVSLGPAGPGSTNSVAVSPDRQVILAIQGTANSAGRQQQLIRSRDAGATWESLPAPGEAGGLTLVTSPDGLTLFAAQASYPKPRVLLRSFDLGETWETVLTVDEKDAGTPLFVVTPQHDGPVLAKIGARLFRAASPRAEWAEVPLPAEQQLQALAPSPNYAQDGLIFAALIRTEPWYWWRDPTEPALTDHERSLGVVASADGGLTWQPVAGQPELDGAAYRHVRTIAVSPAFATDRTLFAHAWGPLTLQDRQDGQRPGWFHVGALFKSRDAGASWYVVDRDDPDVTGYYARIAVSPSFATDGVALLSRTNAAGTNTCVELRTTDGGDIWTVFRKRTGKALGCSRPRLFTQNGQLRALLEPYEWSPDGGQTWGRAAVPGNDGLTIVPASGVEADIYVGGHTGGIWAFGPGVQATNGRLPCALQPAPQIGALLSAEPRLRTPLGCPTELERPVTFRQRETVHRQREPAQGYWIEAQGDSWLAVRERTSEPGADAPGWSWESKLRQPWPETGHTVQNGTIQRFAGGFVLTHQNTAGGRTALVFVNGGGVFRRELP